MQALEANAQCRLDLESALEHLLARFAQPLVERVSQDQTTDVATKYSSSYSVTQDTFLYDHVKVCPSVAVCLTRKLPNQLACLQAAPQSMLFANRGFIDITQLAGHKHWAHCGLLY